MGSILEALGKQPLFFDGAMGTELQKRGFSQDPAILNRTHPTEIISVHREYLEAGTDIITANTFGAYTHKHSDAAEMIEAAIAHGRKALSDFSNKTDEAKKCESGKAPGTTCKRGDKWLALDLGPTGLMLEPYGDTTKEECQQIYNAAVNAGAAADMILIETMMDLAELEIAVTEAKATGLPVFATMSFDKKGRTMMGASVGDMVSLLEGLGVDALGVNCGFGPDIYLPLVAELKEKTRLPIIVQPNAGMPVANVTESVGSGAVGAVQYDLSVEDFAAAVASMGVDIMGGCCGTSPAHIKALIHMNRS